MSYNWVNYFGSFSTEGSRVIFKGKEMTGEKNGGTKSSAGICICDQRFSGGMLEGDVTFAESSTNDLACQFILYFDPASKFMVTAGIGVDQVSLFYIGHFDGKNWTAHQSGGDPSQIVIEKKFKLKVILKGSQIILSIDGVDIGSVVLPFNIPQGQVGLFFKSKNNVTVENFNVVSEIPKAFIVMQFSQPFNELYDCVVKPICDELKIDPRRADETYGPGLIIADIMKKIDESKVVIADITPSNPNVFY